MRILADFFQNYVDDLKTISIKIITKLFSYKSKPVKTLTQRSCGANGLTSHILIVLSIAFDNKYEPSLLKESPVTVSVCPRIVYNNSFFLTSQTFMSLSIPPLNICSAVSLKQTAVT